jgi:CO/xanthine dehydrogenase FAD-binding subunit
MNPVSLPRTLDEVYAALDADPAAQLLAGGTDLLVELNHGRRRVSSVVALRHVAELRGWRQDGDTVVIGAGCTYREMEEPDFASFVPALSTAARTVGSPQIRSAGTIGGNIATASPAGDTLPVLVALEATLTLGSSAGVRSVPVEEFFTGPKRTVRAPNEVIVDVRVPVLDGPQEYLKIGTRNAMVIAVADLALVVDRSARNVRCAMGSVGPTVLRARDAEAWVAGEIDWTAGTVDVVDATCIAFARLVADAARPIDDHRSTAAYRRRGIEVLAARALGRVLHKMGDDT